MAATALINIGSSANDGTGDPLRTAFGKINGSSSARVFSTSGAGAVDDADVSLNSATYGTDNTATLQALLDLALTGPICIIWDGQYSATNLTIHSNTKIIALPGCGVIQRPGSTGRIMEALGNGSDITGGWGSNIDIENISIEKLTINCRVDGGASAILFQGVKNIYIKDCTVIGGRYFSVHNINTENSVWENLICLHDDVQLNHDGLHFSGYNRNICVRNLTGIGCTDDVLSFNTHESTNAIYIGPMYNILVDGVIFNYAASTGYDYGVAIWLGTYGIENISVSNIRGNPNSHFIRTSYWVGTGGILKGLKVDGIFGTLKSTGNSCILLQTNYDFINVSNVFVSIPINAYLVQAYAGNGGTLTMSDINVLIPSSSDSSGTINGLIYLRPLCITYYVILNNITVNCTNTQASSGKALLKSSGSLIRTSMSNIQSALPRIIDHQTAVVSPSVSLSNVIRGGIVYLTQPMSTLNVQGYIYSSALGAFVQGGGVITNDNQVNVQAL